MVSPRGNVFAPYQELVAKDTTGIYSNLMAVRERARNDQMAAKAQTYHEASNLANDQVYTAAVDAHVQQYYQYPSASQAYYYPGPVEQTMASQVGPTGYRGYGRTATGLPGAVEADQARWASQTMQRQQYGNGREFATPFEPVQTFATYF